MVTNEKDRVRETIYAQRDQFIRITHDLHDHPELAFCEEFAAARITEFLKEQGFTVQKGICGLPTAFVASYGHGSLHIAFCAEYDALPPACLFDRSKPTELVEVWLTPEPSDPQDPPDAPVRHACGHNIIAAASVAAAVGLRDIADEIGMTISVFGTPGEELYGIPEPRDGRLAPGKILLLERGAFAGIHAVLMVHPFPTPWSVIIPTHVCARLRAQFSKTGTGSQGMRTPELKRLEEALKKVILSFHQMPGLYVARPEDHCAGAQAEIMWVAQHLADTPPVVAAVRRPIEEAASAAGVTVQIQEYAPGANMRHDPKLSDSFRKNSEVLGRIRAKDETIQAEIREVFSSPKLPLPVRLLARSFPHLFSPSGLFMSKFPVKIVYGTDLANVSQVIPAIHPYIGIGGTHGPHMAEFADDVETAEAYRAMLDGGIALAWTALNAATDSTLREYLLQVASTKR